MKKQTENRGLSPFPRLSGRLYIFPALIPLVEILPWLLTAVGALAGATQLAFWQRHRKKVLAFAIVCFLGAGGVYVWSESGKPSAEEGSLLVAAAELPQVTHLNDVPKAKTPLDKKHDVFEALWTVKTKNESLATPVMAGDVMLVGTFAATIDARARANGKLLWSLKKHEPVFTNTVISNGIGYVGEGLHTAPTAGLTAFSVKDGKAVWERRFRSHVEADARLDEKNNRLFTPAGDEGLWALSMDDGGVLWRAQVGHTDATPLLKDGVLYVSAQPEAGKVGAELSALDPDNGKADWKTALPGNTMGSPQAGEEGVIFLATAIGQVGPEKPDDRGWSHAVSRKGKILWTAELPGMPLPEAAILRREGLVIHTLKNGEIVALKAADGKQAWRVKLGKAIYAPSALRADVMPPLLATITTEGAVVLTNAEDGTEIRRFNVKKGGYAAPVFYDDMLYITAPKSITAYGGVNLLARERK